MAPAWAGAALAAGHVLVGFAFYAVAVARGPGAAWSAYREDLGAAAVFGLLIGYGAAALAYARRGHRAAFARIRGSLRAPAGELDRAEHALERFDVVMLRRAGGVAVVASLVVTLFTTGLLERLGPRDPVLAWILWQNAVAAWLVTRTLVHDLQVSGLFARWTEHWAEVELLNPSPLAPLARRGLQSALVVVLAASIFALVFGLGNVSPLVPLVQVSALAIAAFALVRPSLGVHRRLRAARSAELARLDAAIRAARVESAEAERLAALLTLRQHVRDAREWPFDPGTLGRFALVATIGLGSWLGGAMVERLLDLLLG